MRIRYYKVKSGNFPYKMKKRELCRAKSSKSGLSLFGFKPQ
jgi:hypothetical protein